MNSDIAKISRLYENTYNDFIKNGNSEKDSINYVMLTIYV